MSLALLLWSAAALGAGPEVWSSLYNGRLIDSIDRDQSAAIAAYEAVLEHLPEDDPQRGAVLYWLGRAQLDAGARDAAWVHLEAATKAGDSVIRSDARRVMAHVELAERRIPTIPFSTAFETELQPLVRGWTRGARADLAVTDGVDPSNAVLRWRVEVQEGSDDFLRAELAPGAGAVQRLRLRLRASDFVGQVRILLEDAQGERWTAPVLSVPTDAWMPVSLGLLDFAPADAPAALRRPEAREIRAIEIRDVSAFHGTERGPNALMIDDVDIR